MAQPPTTHFLCHQAAFGRVPLIFDWHSPGCAGPDCFLFAMFEIVAQPFLEAPLPSLTFPWLPGCFPLVLQLPLTVSKPDPVWWFSVCPMCLGIGHCGLVLGSQPLELWSPGAAKCSWTAFWTPLASPPRCWASWTSHWSHFLDPLLTTLSATLLFPFNDSLSNSLAKPETWGHSWSLSLLQRLLSHSAIMGVCSFNLNIIKLHVFIIFKCKKLHKLYEEEHAPFPSPFPGDQLSTFRFFFCYLFPCFSLCFYDCILFLSFRCYLLTFYLGRWGFHWCAVPQTHLRMHLHPYPNHRLTEMAHTPAPIPHTHTFLHLCIHACTHAHAHTHTFSAPHTFHRHSHTQPTDKTPYPHTLYTHTHPLYMLTHPHKPYTAPTRPIRVHLPHIHCTPHMQTS